MTPHQIEMITPYASLFSTVAAIVSCAVTIVLAILTRSYVRLTRELVLEAKAAREEEARPKIMVTIVPRDDEASWIDLIVKNIGRGYAHNVRFHLEPDFSLASVFETRASLNLSDIGFIANGIPSFAPEQKLQFFLTNLIGTLEEKARQPIGITVSYKDTAGKNYEDHCVLDFGLFRNMATVGKPPMETIANSLEKMQKDINNLATGWTAISVRLKDRRVEPKQQAPEIILPPGASSVEESIGSFN